MMWCILVATYFLTNLTLHSITCHLIGTGTVFAKFFVVGAIIGCVMLAHFYYLYGVDVEFITAALTYGFLCELYIFLFSFIASSISVSILLRVRNSEITVTALADNYRSSTMVNNRLRRMCDVGLLYEIDGILQLTNA